MLSTHSQKLSANINVSQIQIKKLKMGRVVLKINTYSARETSVKSWKIMQVNKHDWIQKILMDLLT